MRLGWLIALSLITSPSFADLQVQPESAMPFGVFAGRETEVPVICVNSEETEFDGLVRVRLFQATAAMAAPVGPAREWKRVRVLKSQRVFEKVAVSFPPVRSETLFVLKFQAGDREVGNVAVRAFPRSILQSAVEMSHSEAIGMVDPGHRIAPVLKSLGIQIHDLSSPADEFEGTLMILGPFERFEDVPENFNKIVAQKCEGGARIILLHGKKLLPGFLPTEVYQKQGGRVVRCESTLLKDLANSPEAQLLLMRMINLALAKEPMELPRFEEQ